MKKKALCLYLAALITLFVGCTNQNQTSVNEVQTIEQVDTSTEAMNTTSSQLNDKSSSPVNKCGILDLSDGGCAVINNNKSLYMWGSNSYGQLGDGTNNYSGVPIKIMENVKTVELGFDYSAAITEDNSLYMWGYNSDGQLGNGTTENSSLPIKILDNVVDVSLGYAFCSAVTENGDLYIWGDDSTIVNIFGFEANNLTPQKVLENAKSSVITGKNLAVITNDNSLLMRGDYNYDQIGNGAFNKERNASKNVIKDFVEVMENVEKVSLSGLACAAITTDGSLYLWGRNAYYQIGDGTNVDRNKPIKVMDNVVDVKLWQWCSSAITKDGGLYTWGTSEYYYQLGNGDLTVQKIPTKILSNVLVEN